MRENTPVTANEYELPEGTFIVSRTDPGGRITWFNEDFQKASGFTAEELQGQPHNIVRHPDMPKEAFADLWANLKAGRPWAGAVKNRRKNGDFYWVFASATPVSENGAITGYLSIRTKLPRADREAVGKIYKQFRDGAAQGMRIENGQVLRRGGLFSRLNVFTRTIRSRLVTLAGVAIAATMLVGVAGVLTVRDSNERLRSVFEDRTIPAMQIAEINERMLDNVTQLYRGAAEGREHGGDQAKKMAGEIDRHMEGNVVAINRLWDAYMATYLTPEEKTLADAYASHRRDFVQKGLAPGRAMLAGARYDAIDTHLSEIVMPLFGTAKKDAEALLKLQVDVAKAEYAAAQANYIR